MAYYTKEIGGTLLIVTKDNRAYEVSRYNSGYSITPDKDTPQPSSEEETQFKKLYRLSNCSRR
tara:strand:- start:2213 stop:2401 length:189 start_codon:yes stop_codon:yes gene_type:complete